MKNKTLIFIIKNCKFTPYIFYQWFNRIHGIFIFFLVLFYFQRVDGISSIFAILCCIDFCEPFSEVSGVSDMLVICKIFHMFQMPKCLFSLKKLEIPTVPLVCQDRMYEFHRKSQFNFEMTNILSVDCLVKQGGIGTRQHFNIIFAHITRKLENSTLNLWQILIHAI